MPLNLNVAVGDSLVVDGGRIVITYESRKGNDAKLSIDAARDISVKLVPGTPRVSPMSKGLSKRGSQE